MATVKPDPSNGGTVLTCTAAALASGPRPGMRSHTLHYSFLLSTGS